MKTFSCLFERDFWSFETDKYVLRSPTGKTMILPAHISVVEGSQEWQKCLKWMERTHGIETRINEGFRIWTPIELTTEEMRAFKNCADMAEAWRYSRR